MMGERVHTGVITDVRLGTTISLSRKVDREVKNYSVKPSIKARLATKRTEISKCLEERFLHDVFSVLTAADDPEGDRVCAVLIPFHQLTKRFEVAVSRALYERPVDISGGFRLAPFCCDALDYLNLLNFTGCLR